MFACDKEKIFNNSNDVIILSVEDLIQNPEAIGIYSQFNIITNGYSSFKILDNVAESDDDLIGSTDNFFIQPGDDRSVSNEKDIGLFSIGDLTFSYNIEKKRYKINGISDNSKELAYKLRNDIMGREVLFSVIGTDDIPGYVEKLYIPKSLEEVNLNNSSRIENSDVFKTSRKNTTIAWEKDKINSNGILISVSFSGNVLNDDLEEVYNNDRSNSVKYFAKIDDTGQFTFPVSFFNGMPKNAIVTISVIRGNIHSFAVNENFTFQITGREEFQRFVALND